MKIQSFFNSLKKKSGFKKRFFVAGGKQTLIKFHRSNHRHNLTSKSPKQKRNSRQFSFISVYHSLKS